LVDLGGSWVDLGWILGGSWWILVDLGGSWVDLGGSWWILDGSWVDLGGSWVDLGGSWVDLGGSWVDLGGSWIIGREYLDMDPTRIPFQDLLQVGVDTVRVGCFVPHTCACSSCSLTREIDQTKVRAARGAF
jgi:hypothetical protein